MTLTLLLALTIAFPRPGQKLPYVERCYMIGAVEPGPTNITVGGRPVAVYRTGAWATLVEVSPGTNTVDVAGSNHWFVIGPKPVRKPSAGPVKPAPRVYEKLPYAGDIAKAVPTNRAPGEVTVVIDAGHGGRDTGALSPHGIEEKDANLRTARALQGELERRGYRVIMTRSDDRQIALYDRPRVAHANNADAFISIHHNAPPVDRDPRIVRYGVVYAWNGIGENLGRAINRRLAEAQAKEGLKNNGVPRANYAVTRNPEIPSCLVEVDFITSPQGEEACWNPKRRRRVAAAIADGFEDWAKGMKKR
jgi:N-acetylmuramoyl-L-alanine amidase